MASLEGLCGRNDRELQMSIICTFQIFKPRNRNVILFLQYISYTMTHTK